MKGDELLPRASASTRRRNPHLFEDLPSDPEQQRHPELQLARANDREAFYKVRVRLRITSFRRRLLDGHWNLHTKHFIDACTELGLIRDDSQTWIEVEQQQVKVGNAHQEYTELLIEPL